MFRYDNIFIRKPNSQSHFGFWTTSVAPGIFPIAYIQRR